MNFLNIFIAICSLLFFMIGADKFLNFLEPPCSLESSINPLVWKALGVLQIIGGILIWFPKYQRMVASFFAGFMLFFTVIHLFNGQYDIGGSASMAVMLGVVMWSPDFLTGKKKSI